MTTDGASELSTWGRSGRRKSGTDKGRSSLDGEKEAESEKKYGQKRLRCIRDGSNQA